MTNGQDDNNGRLTPIRNLSMFCPSPDHSFFSATEIAMLIGT